MTPVPELARLQRQGLPQQPKTPEQYDAYVLGIWDKIRSGNMKRFPNGFFNTPENRITLIIALVNELNDEPDRPRRYPSQKDFHGNGLSGLIGHKYNASPYAALEEAGYTTPGNPQYDPELAETPWLKIKVTQRYWDEKENRTKAVNWLVTKTRKDTGNKHEYPTQDDFHDNGLAGLLTSKYDGSPYAALQETGYTTPGNPRYDPELAETPWLKIKVTHRYWKKESNRVKAVEWLKQKVGRYPTQDDFNNNDLKGLIDFYNGSNTIAIQELKRYEARAAAQATS